MYKLINDKKVYETSEVDATTSRIEGVAQLAEGLAREASATANAISDTANKALEDATFAKGLAASHDEVITEITQTATQSLDKAMEAKAIAEATDAKATAAVVTANEALTEATNHVIYTNTLPTTDIKNIIYAVKHSYNITNDISARADDILGSYFHLVSSGKYVIDDVYTLQYNNNNEWHDIGSIFLRDETLNCYRDKDFSSLYTWTLNLGDTYNFRLITVMNHWDYYAGSEAEQTLTKLANAQQVEDLFLRKTLAGTPGGLATLDGDGKILITQLPTNTTIFRGNWDASAGTYPASTGITPGDWYLVSVAGTIGNVKYAVNDRIMWSGTAWVKQTATGEVVSVNGRSNVVTGLMEATNPVGTGSFSMNRKAGSTVGINSFAEGHTTVASGQYSHAEGHNTEAKGQSQHVAGQYNIADSTSVRITGWGTSAGKKNIEQLDQSGNLRLKGSVYVGCNDDSSGGTKIDTEMASNAANSASAAANSASEATSSANLAGTYASRSATSAREAATSASNAANSASAAANSASEATSSANLAGTYASRAATSASNAATSASNAATSATNAANAANAVKTALGNIKHVYWNNMAGSSAKKQNDVYNDLLATLSADQKTLLSQGKTLRIFCLPYANSVEPALNQTGICAYIDVTSTKATFYTAAIYTNNNNSPIGNRVNSVVMTKGTTSVPSGQTIGNFYFIPGMCLAS